MNRRELLQRLAGAVAISGVAVTAAAIDAPTEKPGLIVIEIDEMLSHEQAERVRQSLEQAMSCTPFEGVKCVVLSRGVKLTVLDAKGRPLSRGEVDGYGAGV